MEDTSYDGERRLDGNLYDGLGKLTDDIYGGKVAEASSTAWVAYKTGKPKMTFHFLKNTVIKQIMIHVNNNNKDIKVFKSVEILSSNDGVKYKPVKTYVTDNDQRNKIDAYAVVCNIGEVVAKHLQLRFTKQGEWLLVSEVVFMTDTYPTKPVIPTETTNNGGETKVNVVFTAQPRNTPTRKNGFEEGENKSNEKILLYDISVNSSSNTAEITIAYSLITEIVSRSDYI